MIGNPHAESGPLHAALLLTAIEQRSAYLQARSRQVVDAFFGGRAIPTEVTEDLIDQAREELNGLTLTRFAEVWKDLVPTDALLRAQLCAELGKKYPLDVLEPELAQAVGLDEPEVIEASLQAFGRTPEELLGASSHVTDDQTPSNTRQRAAFLRVAEADLEWVILPTGQVLFHQGDPGDSLFVIVSGHLRVLAEYPDGTSREVTTLGPGELVGEMAVITGRSRSATIDAKQNSELVRLSKASFDQLLDRHPRAMMPVIRLLIDRLDRREESLVRQVVQLTIEINEAKKNREVSQIVDTDFFRQLQDRAQELRGRRAQSR